MHHYVFFSHYRSEQISNQISILKNKKMSETHQRSIMCLIVKNKKAMIWFTQRLTLISRFLSRQVRFISEEKMSLLILTIFHLFCKKIQDASHLTLLRYFPKLTNDLLSYFRYIRKLENNWDRIKWKWDQDWKSFQYHRLRINFW